MRLVKEVSDLKAGAQENVELKVTCEVHGREILAYENAMNQIRHSAALENITQKVAFQRLNYDYAQYKLEQTQIHQRKCSVLSQHEPLNTLKLDRGDVESLLGFIFNNKAVVKSGEQK